MNNVRYPNDKFVVTGIHQYIMVKQQLHTNHQRERSCRKKDIESLEI